MGSSGRSPGVEYRHANEADIPAEHAVFVAAEGELLERHGFGWPEPPPLERLAPSLRHLLRTDGQRCFVAEADGNVVGYSAAWVRDDIALLAALFIEPGFQGSGVGRQLLELAFAGAPAKRMTISDAIQPVSNALYVKNGMVPATPILGFEGQPTNLIESGLVASDATPASLSLLDRAGYGFDRAIDHEYWATQATATLWLRGGEAVAYSYRWPRGRIGPLVGRDQRSAADALSGELNRPAQAYIEVPGSSPSLVQTALAAGMRLTAPPGLLLVSDGVKLPQTIAISGYGLM